MRYDEVSGLLRQRRCFNPARANCPIVKPENTAHTVVDRSNRIGATGVRTRLGEHPVAIGNKVSSISLVPGDRTLFQGIKPIKENLGIRPDCIVGMSSLDGMLMKKCNDGLNDLHRIGEENRKALEPWLT
jgi:hypothetical protein